MKINTARKDQETSGSLETKAATLELNAVISHILSRDLYTRPAEAALREILINAIDAHREAGATVPVEVKLPSWIEPVFSIRDYGFGIPHDKMMEIYLDYGKSTRRGTNDLHGGLGLGTKAPLAYVDAFSVTSFNGGEKREYLIYHNEDGIPTRDLRTVSPTSETGLLVEFTLRDPADAGDFRRAAKAVLPWIPDSLYAINRDDEDFKPRALNQARQVDVGLRTGDGLEVVMGFQRYDCSLEMLLVHMDKVGLSMQLPGSTTTLNMSKVVSNLAARNRVTVFCDIGDIQPHPSRESVIVTARTTKLLAGKLAAGVQKMFGDMTGYDIRRDIEANKVLGWEPAPTPVTGSKSEARIRVANTYSWSGYTQSMELSPRQENYSDLILHLAGMDKDVVVGFLSQYDWTDYAGGSRTRIQRPDGLDTEYAVVLVDKDNTHEDILEALKELPITDLEDDVVAFRRLQEREAQRTQWAVTRTRTVVRSMQDPAHNVLELGHDYEPNRGMYRDYVTREPMGYTTRYCSFYPEENSRPWDMVGQELPGATKKDWTSQTRTLADYEGKNVFWTETRMGCAVDRIGLGKIAHDLYRLWPLIPEEERPIILGLPASKGTKRFERALSPIDELPVWLENFMRRPEIRRRLTYATLWIILDELHIQRDLDKKIELFGSNQAVKRLVEYYDLCKESLSFGPDTYQKEWTVFSFRHLTDEAKTFVDVEWLLQAKHDILNAIGQVPAMSTAFYTYLAENLAEDETADTVDHRRHQVPRFFGDSIISHKETQLLLSELAVNTKFPTVKI